MVSEELAPRATINVGLWSMVHVLLVLLVREVRFESPLLFDKQVAPDQSGSQSPAPCLHP